MCENNVFVTLLADKMNTLYVLLGGNLGDKKQIFTETRERLSAQIGKIVQQSAVYETEPWGFESEDVFWNQVLVLETCLSPIEILSNAKEIEAMLGRIRKEKQYDSRIIDIDILFFNNQIVSFDNLTIPHPRIQDRKFVLVPLNELVPDFTHPVFGKSMRQMLADCTDNLKVEKLAAELY